MSYKIENPRDEQDRKHAFDKHEPERVFARPFDASELDSLPQPTDDDPPYRPWWVIDRD
jgi:hypothetical protein